MQSVCPPAQRFPERVLPAPLFPRGPVVPWSSCPPAGFLCCRDIYVLVMPRPPRTALRAPHNTRPSWETRVRGPLCWVPLWEKHKQRWAPRSLRRSLRGVRPFFGRAPLTVGRSLSAPLSVRAWSAVRCLSRLVSLSRCLVSSRSLCFVSRCLFGKRCEWVFTPAVLRGCLCGCAKEGFLGLFVLLLSHRSLCALPPLQLFSGTVCIIYKCFGIAARCRPGPLDQLNYTLLLCSVLLFPSLLVLLLFWPCVCVFAAPVVSLVARPFASLLSPPSLLLYIT